MAAQYQVWTVGQDDLLSVALIYVLAIDIFGLFIKDLFYLLER